MVYAIINTYTHMHMHTHALWNASIIHTNDQSYGKQNTYLKMLLFHARNQTLHTQ